MSGHDIVARIGVVGALLAAAGIGGALVAIALGMLAIDTGADERTENRLWIASSLLLLLGVVGVLLAACAVVAGWHP